MSQVVNGNFIVYAELSFRLFNILNGQSYYKKVKCGKI